MSLFTAPFARRVRSRSEGGVRRPVASRRRPRSFGEAERLERRDLMAVDIAKLTPDTFFINTDNRTITSEYEAIQITNNTGAAIADLWVRATDFTGGVVGLGTNEDGYYQIGALANGQTDIAYFYLRASGATAVDQVHTIRLFSGDPREGGTPLEDPVGTPVTATSTFFDVLQTIEASANKIFTVAYDSPDPVLGSTLTMTVTGDLGQANNDSVLFTPASFDDWLPDVYVLESSTINITGPNARTLTNDLYDTGFGSSSSNLYTAVYTFRLAGVSTGTTASPTQFVGRNQQWKHHAPGNVVLPPVSPVANSTTVQKLVALPGNPGQPSITIPETTTSTTVEFSLRFTNTSTRTVTLNSILDTLPSLPQNATYLSGTSTYDNNGTPQPIANPTVTGQDLKWQGPFSILPNSTAVLKFRATIPPLAGTYVNSATGRIGTTVIDTTLDTTDNVPATASVICAKFADLNVLKTRSSGSPVAGESVTYEIKITNQGPSTVLGFTLTDTTAPVLIGATYGTPSAGTFNPATGAWSGLTLTTGQFVTITLTGIVPATASGNLVNTATAEPQAGVIDPDPTDNSSTVTDVLLRKADLSVVKTRTSGAPVAGESVTYLISVTNQGPSTITGFTFTDTTAPVLIGATYGTPSAGTYNSATGEWTGLSLGTGQTVTITLTGTVPAAAIDSLVNTATVAPPSGVTDPDPTDNTSTVTDVLGRESDLNVLKTRTSGSPVAGESVTYEIKITNQGPSTVTGFTLTDTTAPVLIGATYGTPSAGTFNPATGAWSGLTLTTGQFVTITLTGIVPATASGNLVNTATAEPQAGVIDPDPTDNSSTVTDVLLRKADLSVVKTRTSGAPVAGESVTYLISVTNQGPSTITGFTFTDTTAPALIGATYGTPSAGSYNPATGAWTGLSLATGQTVTITLTGTVPAAAIDSLVNTATVAPPAGVTDPDPTDNTSTVTDVLGRESDLNVLKTRTSGSPVAGESVTYEIKITNQGPSTVLGFTLTDTTAPVLIGATYGTPSAGTFNPATGAWSGLTLTTGQFVTITLTGIVPATASGNLVNTATAEPQAGVIDPDPTDNSSTVTDVLLRKADLSVVKTRTSGAPVAGESVTYLISVTNQGPSTITGFTFTDTTAPVLIGATYGTPSAGTYNSATGEWTGLSLGTGQTVTITLTGTVPAAAIDSLVNTATVAPPAGVTDPDPTDNTSTVTDVLGRESDLNVLKTRTSGSPVAGESVTYEIKITNQGPSMVTGFTLTDTTAPVLIGATYGTPSAGTFNPATGAWSGLTLTTGQFVTITLTGIVPATASGNLVNTATAEPQAGVIDPDPTDNSSTVTDVLLRKADLSVVKTRTSDAPVAGESVTYLISVTNQGPSTITGFTFTDTTAPVLIGATYGTPSAGAYNPATGAWTGLSLATGQTVTITLTGTVPAAATDSLVNTATVAPPAGVTDPDPTDNTSTVTDVLGRESDLNVLKTRTSGSPVAGESVTYEIKITNQGPSTVTGFTLTDTTAPVLIGATYGTPSAGTFNPATGAWSGLTLTTGQFVTITLTGIVPATASGNLVNTATAEPQAGVIDPDPTDNSSTVTDVLLRKADLSVVKTRTSGAPVAGETVTYLISVTNQGPSTITGFTFTDTTAPALIGATYGTPSAGSYNPATGAWTGLSLATGQTVTITLTGTVPAAAIDSLVNTATVEPPSGVTDPDPTDNTSTVTDVLGRESDLNVLKTRTSGSPVAGESVTYEIKITNQGPSTVTGFTLTDTTAPVLIGATYGTPSAGTFNPATGAWSGLTLTTGQFVTITLTGIVPATASGNLVNTATAEPQPGVIDPDPTDNSSTVTDVLLRKADLSVVKTRTSGAPVAGEAVTYLISVTNQGPSTITGFTFTDTTAPVLIGATYGTPSAGTYNSATGEWTGLSLGTGQTVTITLTGTVPAAAIDSLVNTATVAPPSGVTDPDPTDNTSTVTDVLGRESDLNVLKTRTSGSPVAGESVTYEIKITNQGPSTVTGFTLTDTTAPVLIGATYGTPSAGTFNPATGAWSGLTLTTGQFVTITLTGIVPATASGNLVNTATAEPQAGVIDPDPTDNSSTVTDVLLLVSDLNVVKVRTSGQPVAGELVSYQITVTNQGPSTITSFTGLDTTMPMLESPSYTVDSGTYDPVTGIWTGPALATGGTVVFTLSGTVPAAATGLLVNTATVLPPDGVTDPDPTDNSSTVTDELDLVSDLNVLKTRTSGSPVAGESVTYEIKITNQGPSTVTGFTLTDTTAPVLIGATYGTPSAGTFNPATGAWSGLTLTTGQFVTITLTGIVPATASGNLVNTATAEPQAGVIDPDPTDNSSTVTDVLLLVSDLNVVKVRTSGQPVAGELVSYQITVTNQGPSTITSFTGLDTTMPMLESPSYTVNSGTYDPVTGIWTGPALATGGTVVFTLSGTVPAAATGLLVNTATVLPPAGVTDPDPTDNSSTVTDEISGVVDLTVTKTGDETYKGGGPLNFTVVVTNNGPSFASGVRVVDTLPAGVVSWSWTVTYTGTGSGTADGSSDSVTASTAGIDKLMNLAVLGTATFTITALTDGDFKSDISNTATATIGQESATATWTSAYDGPINPTADVAALIIGTDDGCGIAPWVRIVDPITGTILSQFLAYEPGFRGGVRVTSGDVTGDGIAEIIVAPGRNRIGQIRVFTAQGVELPQYRTFPFGTAYRGGVEVAVGDVDGDGDNDIIAGMSTGVPMVRVFAVAPGAGDPVANVPFRSFRAFPAPYANGTMVAAGDFGTYFNGVKTSSAPDGVAEIVTGTNAGTRAWTRIWDVTVAPKVVRGAFVIAPGFRGGVTLSTARWDGDAVDDLIVGAGIGGNSIVEVYSGATGSQLTRLTAFSSFVKTNARAFAAALDLSGDGIADNLYGVKGLNGGGGARGVRQYARPTGIVSQLTSSPLLAPPLRIAPITLRVPAP